MGAYQRPLLVPAPVPTTHACVPSIVTALRTEPPVEKAPVTGIVEIEGDGPGPTNAAIGLEADVPDTVVPAA
ncbi:MAG: hypothetical protein ACRENE_08150 [Polyangiaceae bacterium]